VDQQVCQWLRNLQSLAWDWTHNQRRHRVATIGNWEHIALADSNL